MDALIQTLRNLGPTRLALMGVVFMLMIGFFIYLTTRLATPQLSLLYGDLDPADAQQIAGQLGAQGTAFELRGNGREVWVPEDKVAGLRMTMADQGLPNGGTIGYELFDNSDSLGTTNFQQNINLIRALEGELSRSIGSIESVKGARVHLVMPKRELFSRERQEPSASIVLKMKGKARLDKNRVSAIQHLVAAAVPSLQPNRISIVDDRGTLLAAGFEDTESIGGMSAKVEERRRAFENRMAGTIEELLEKSVGFGRVRAEVSADMDFDRVVTNEELYDPEGQVVRSTQTSEQTASSREAQGTSPVGVATNLPDANLGSEDQASATNAESRTEEIVNFEISKRIVSHTREAGVIKRLSVAVLVDGTYTQNEEDEDIMDYQPRTQEEMDQFEQLVRTAVGIDDDRGDEVKVINMKFADVGPKVEQQIELFFGFDKDDVLRMAEILVLSIVAILVILLVVRPLVTRAFESIPSVGPAEGLLSDGTGAPALTGPGSVPVPSEMDEEEEQFDELIDIDRVEGRVKASSVKKVGEIVDKHPEEALSIIRNWMYQES